jgi:antitoxin ParD1/3/4/toxin ParE1/3/4
MPIWQISKPNQNELALRPCAARRARQSSESSANRVESVIRNRIAFLSGSPGAGHWRKDLTDETVKFFPVYSYLIVYRPETKPLQVVSILHGRRDVGKVLEERR